MEHVPFSIINEYLKGKLLHPSRYCGAKYAFLKIFQHGLYYHFTKQEYKIIFNYLKFPIWFQQLVYRIKARVYGKPKKTYSLNEYVILIPDRAVLNPDGNWHSIYFDRIAELIGKERVTTINQVESCQIKSDFTVSDFSGIYPALDARELDVLREIKLTLQAARRSKQFSYGELKQIRSAMHIFFEEFRLYYNLLKGQPTRKILLLSLIHI
jgi:hypothetical protein